jgi:signal transduction histidine kinase
MLRLKTHALAASLSLVALTALLGGRAYSVASAHFDEARVLVDHDLRSEELLARLESLAESREQALRKWEITGNESYSTLARLEGERMGDARAALRVALGGAHSDLAGAPLERAEDLRALRLDLETRREARIRGARDAALGLQRLIAAALVLSAAITAWLLFLFYRGILDPLGTLQVATLRLSSGELSHRIAAVPAIAEFRELSASFNAMAARLQSLEQAKSDFLATVSHEIKNPLAALKEGLSFLSSQGDQVTAEARSRALGACLIASKRVETLINNLLKLSRGEAGLFEFDVSRKNLAEAIRVAIDEVRPVAERKRMPIELEAESELEASFNWDGMVQVFVNLLMNAVKYGREGTPIGVRAGALAGDAGGGRAPVPHIEMEVCNAGKGIAAGELERIFDRFYRGVNSEKKQGLGLGLHVVKSIVEAHHGGVLAESGGEGTRIRLWIPRQYESPIVGEARREA